MNLIHRLKSAICILPGIVPQAGQTIKQDVAAVTCQSFAHLTARRDGMTHQGVEMSKVGKGDAVISGVGPGLDMP